MKKKNVLYLLEMGCNDSSIPGDIKNHRVRVLENIDILFNGEKYNMFFEFSSCTRWHYRYNNLRTGKPLKKPVYVVDNTNGLYIDTQFERMEEKNGRKWESSWRNSKLEKEFWNEHHSFASADILECVNRYKIGEPFTSVCLIETTAREIIKRVGGFRELDILGEDRTGAINQSYFKIGDTWNDEHKIMRCVKRENWKDVDFCEVDLITGRITG